MAEPTAVQRRGLAKLGLAMPDGSYYIRNGSVGASDLENAIEAVGRGEPQASHNAIRVHIMRRAKALRLSDKIPADWQADGSLKHGDMVDQLADNFLEHFGILGMRWGHHLPGVEVLGGPGNGDRKPAPFIQRGDHTGDKPGDSGPSGQDNTPHEQQAQHALDALKALHDRVSQMTEAARTEAEAAPAATPAKATATAVHAASVAHKAAVATVANKATKAHAAHKAAVAKLAKHPHKAKAKKAHAAAAKLHAAHMNHLKQVAHKAHAAHKAHVARLKAGAHTTHLTAHDKAELAKLSPVQRSALKKLTPQQRATLHKMTPAQRAKLSHLTQAEKTALSHLSPKQIAALAKATAASAKKRHEAAVARKANTHPAPKKPANNSAAAARKVTAAAQARRTPAQRAAVARLAANAQNGMLRLSMDDPEGTFLEHHGVKGQKWGVRKARSAVGTGVNRVAGYAVKHPYKTAIAVRGAQVAYQHRAQLADVAVKAVGTAKIIAHIAKVLNEQRNSPQGQETLALGRAYVQGHVIHVDFAQADEFLEHHGIKGMKWGVRRNGGHPGREESHPVSADAQKAHDVARTAHEHGTAALSNDDLQHLVNRQRLLQQHAQLNPGDPSNYRKGLDFVKSVTGDAKTVIDAVDTGRRAVKTFNGLASERPAGRQSRRKRNAPLKVVSVRAA